VIHNAFAFVQAAHGKILRRSDAVGGPEEVVCNQNNFPQHGRAWQTMRGVCHFLLSGIKLGKIGRK